MPAEIPCGLALPTVNEENREGKGKKPVLSDLIVEPRQWPRLKSDRCVCEDKLLRDGADVKRNRLLQLVIRRDKNGHFVLPDNVLTLVEGEKEAGDHGARFDAGGLPSGVYLRPVAAENFTMATTLPPIC
jgi:hypothetical protein